MDFTELQNLWSQYNRSIAANTRVNKEILKKMILSKTQKKINWIKFWAVFHVIIPLPMIAYIAFDVNYRNTTDFYIGLAIASLCFIILYICEIKYYLLSQKIDFMKPVTMIKKDLNKLKLFKIKKTKLGLVIAPFFITGIFMFAHIIPVFSLKPLVLLFNSLILLVMITSAFLKYNYGFFEQMKKINLEMEELENLEKE